MRIRRYIALPVLAACASFAGCSSKPDSQDDLAAQLEKDTGVGWTVYVDPRSNEVRFLAPQKPVSIGSGSPDEKARAFFMRYRDGLHASGKGDELRPVSTTTDGRGMRHLRYEHFLPGTNLRVFDSGTTAHFTADGEVTWLQTNFHADLTSIGATPTVSSADASSTAIAHVASECDSAGAGAAKVSGTELGVLADEDRHPTLAYRLSLDVESERCVAPTVLVDATTGAFIRLEEGGHGALGLVRGSHSLHGEAGDVKTISVSPDPSSKTPRYNMITDSRDTGSPIAVRTGRYSTQAIFASPNVLDWDVSAPVQSKGSAVDAHYYVTQSLKYYAMLANPLQSDNPPFSRDVNVLVHWTAPNGGSVANAKGGFDAARNRDFVVLGDGNPGVIKNAYPWSAAFDIVAHETAHIITDHTSKLAYRNESGALNESFSDVMGASAEHWVSPDPGRNLTIGEDLYFLREGSDKSLLRSLDNPFLGGQPNHETGYVQCGGQAPSQDNDFCNVHTNSSIPSLAFALMVQGGVAVQPDGSNIGIPSALGWEKATEVWYWSMTGLSSEAGFVNAAAAQIAEATARFPFDATARATVACAWFAVGLRVPTLEFTEELLRATCVAPPAAPPPPPAPVPPAPDLPAPAPQTVCEGQGTKTICDPSTPDAAVVCVANAVAGAFTCADPSQHCVPKSATDPTATFDINIDNPGLDCN